MASFSNFPLGGFQISQNKVKADFLHFFVFFGKQTKSPSSKYDVKCRAAASKILVYVKDSFRSALERNVDIHSMLRLDNYKVVILRIVKQD